MLKPVMNIGWLGVASTVVLGALACAECYVQETTRMTAAENASATSAGAEISRGLPR